MDKKNRKAIDCLKVAMTSYNAFAQRFMCFDDQGGECYRCQSKLGQFIVTEINGTPRAVCAPKCDLK